MKMNWKNLLFLFGVVCCTTTLSAQTNLLNAQTPDEIGVKTAEQQAADNDQH